ncbi:MAG: hypothetical protein JOZ39_07520, partial [Chloroflexi bacterium]|nr:hypothetical protein [Chloroflexota bacterium]
MSRRRALTGAVSGLLLIAVILGLHTALQRQLSNAAAPPLITPSATPPAGPSATPSSIAIPGSPTPTVAAAPSPTPEPTPPAATSTPPRPTATPGAPTATQPPAATATPAPTLPPTPVGTVITDTKLGVGVYSTTMDMNTVRLFRPSAILIQEPDPRTAHNYRDNFPKALIVGRHYVPDGDPLLAHCGDPAEDHRAKGVAFADFIARSAVPLKGVVDAWVSD